MLQEQHRKNLETLKRYLAEYTIGSSPVAFTMRRFDDDRYFGLPLGGATRRTDCGTVGCAVGHAPYAGIPKVLTESWEVYAQRVFGVSPDHNLIAWEWLFEADWADRDRDTAYEAAQRIQYYLDNDGDVPTTGEFTWDDYSSLADHVEVRLYDKS